jgi:peptidoglycan glycosyltransferase
MPPPAPAPLPPAAGPEVAPPPDEPDAPSDEPDDPAVLGDSGADDTEDEDCSVTPCG